MAVPDFMADTPDKPIVHFDERPAGTPEAVHSYFYPGENTGWEFIYPKGTASQATAALMPATAPLETAAAVDLPQPPEVNTEAPKAAEETAVEEALMQEAPKVEPEPPALMPSAEADTQSDVESTMLPETASLSGLELIAGLAMLGAGVVTVLASRRTSAV
jgi:type IV secretory pathway VirB10-like protein